MNKFIKTSENISYREIFSVPVILLLSLLIFFVNKILRMTIKVLSAANTLLGIKKEKIEK